VAKKNNIEFYPHYCDSDKHWKFEILRAEYGWAGEGMFWALNNMVAQAENTILDLTSKSRKAQIANYFKMSLEQLDKYLNFLSTDCDLIIYKEELITTEIVKQTFDEVSKNREEARLRKEKFLKVRQTNAEERKSSANLSEVRPKKEPVTHIEESKVKYSKSKVEESKEKETIISSETSSEVFEKKLCDKEFPKGEPIKVTHIPEEEKKEESSAKEEKADKPPKKPREDLHWKVISAYDKFVKERTGLPAMIDATQGEAAKKIIKYLTNASASKDEDGCIKGWNYILSNWQKLTDYQQNRLKLSEISSDIIKILDQIKNGTPAKQNKRVDTVAPGGNYGKP
jgi:hypothetical protein